MNFVTIPMEMIDQSKIERAGMADLMIFDEPLELDELTFQRGIAFGRVASSVKYLVSEGKMITPKIISVKLREFNDHPPVWDMIIEKLH